MPKEHRRAATAELRDFLAQMRGKSPQEMLGAVASSNLAQSTIAAASIITALIVALTLIPFGYQRMLGGDGTPIPPSASPASATPLVEPAPPTLDIDRAADAAGALGIDKSESVPANVNPLESSTGDLLDGLE